MTPQEKKFPPSTLLKISEALIASDQIPLLRKPLALPAYEEFASSLAKIVEAKEMTTKASSWQWRTKEALLEQMGENFSLTGFLFSPLQGEAYWIMSKSDIHKFTTLALFKNGENKSFLSEVLEEGYFRYLLLEMLALLSKKEPFSEFSLKFSDSIQPKEESFLCQDLHMKMDGHALFARVALSSSLQSSWNKYFSSSPALFSKELASSIELPLTMRIGSLLLSPLVWQKVQVGDFLLLDPMEYDPRKGKFSLTIYVKGIPLFQAQRKKEQIQLINYASSQEPFMENKAEETPPTEISLGTIPMTIHVELGHIPISLQKLTELQPGNFLELPPSETISLIVEGKRIARGELVYLGEVLGVRISEIG